MKFIFCIDKKNGMMFFGKRQSQDRVLREYILAKIPSSAKLWMSEYSKEQFNDDEKIVVDNQYLQNANDEDYCFVEDLDYDVSKTDEIILCHWNRQYQADVFFKLDLKKERFQRISKENIKGSSHDKITIEVYKRG